MDNIIAKIDREKIKKELNSNTFVRQTKKGNKEIFICDYHNSPAIIQEIGRLREITFREASGGTGKEIDLDEYDTADIPFKQLFVWDPIEEEIVGGYRFLEGYNILKSGFDYPKTPTTQLFNLSEQFKKDYFPTTFELGRSFVQPLYQPNNNIRKGMYSLDNLWDGLGELIVEQPEMNYFFGKVTMYPNYNFQACDILHYFLKIYFADTEKLVSPTKILSYKTNTEEFDGLFTGNNYQKEFKILNQKIRQYGENIPPLMNAYMNLSKSMKYFGASINTHFGNVEETGILIQISDIYDTKKERHIHHINKNRISK